MTDESNNLWSFEVAENAGGGLPEGTYTGEFVGVERLPEQPPDPMTGKGERKWPSIVFKWRVVGSEHDGKDAIRETSVSNGQKSAYVQTCGWLLGRTLTAKDSGDIRTCVGKKYLLTVSRKIDKDGRAKDWRHVSQVMPLPQQ